MEVPLAITAFSASDIEAMNVKSISDISRMTPSFTFVQGGAGRNDRSSGSSLTFRGLFLSNNAGASAGGLLFIDGTPVIGANPPSPTDVQRIEILKGPQSAYFGRSTFMGAINFVTRDPSTEYQGRVAAEYATFDSHEESLSIEGPIAGDKLTGRIGFRNFTRGGYYTNAMNPDEKLGAQNTKSIAASFVAKPMEGLRAKLFINYYEDSDGPPANSTLLSPQFNCAYPAPALPGGYYCGELPGVNGLPARQISADTVLTPTLRNQLNGVPQRWTIFDPMFLNHFGVERRAFQTDLRLDYDFAGGWSASSVTAYHRDKNSTLIDSSYTGDGDRPNLLYNPAIAPNNTYPQFFTYMRLLQGLGRDWSQELRVTSPQDWRLRGTVGANYLNYASPGGTVYGVDVRGPAFAGAITRARLITPAVFGGVYFDILDNLTLSAEARYQWDKVKQQPYVNLQGNLVTGPGAAMLHSTFKSFSPRISLDWNFAPDSTIYALWSRGYRPGGFNAALATAAPDTLVALKAAEPNAGLTFDQEQLDNYEAGIKATFWDRRARASLSVYYDKYLNGQVGASIPVRSATLTNLVSLTINSGTAILKGFEFESEFQVNRELKISATAALNDTEVGTANRALYNCTNCTNVYGNSQLGLGNRLPTTPKWSWTLTAEYVTEFYGDYDLFTRVDYAHKGLNYTDFSNAAWIGSADTVNFRMGIRNEDFTLEGFVTNLTDDNTFTYSTIGQDIYSFAFPPLMNSIRVSLPLPRMFGVRAAYNF